MEVKQAKKLTRKKAYLIGITTVIFLTIVNQFLIQRVISEQKYDATVINLAGKQRMLSQKIAKDVYRSTKDVYPIQQLKETVKNWNKVHEGLQNGDEELGLPILINEDIKSLFMELSVNQRAISFAILEATSNSDLEDVKAIVSENESEFLSLMDEIVSALEKDSNASIRRLVFLELVLATFSLIVLLLEFKFIFRPLYEKISTEKTKLEDTITELIESKGSLFRATKRFNLSIEAINAGIWDWDIIDGSEWWSEKFYELLGYSALEIPATYDTFLNALVHPEDKQRVEDAVHQHLEKKVSYKIDIRMKMKDGGYRWFETVGQASWEKNVPIRMVGSIIDIDEKKQFENQLRNDRQLLEFKTRELEETVSDFNKTQEVAKIGVWDVDLKTMTVNWSDEVYRIHEVPVGTELNVEEGINFYRKDYQPVIQSAINKSITENENWDLECVLVTTSGREVWVRAVGYPVFRRGDLVSLHGVFMDIDSQKRAQLDLEEQKNKLEEISTKLSLAINTGQIGVWTWDILTNGLEWDDQMLEIYGITREKFTDGYDSYSEALFPEDLPRIERELEYSIKNKTRFDTNFRIRKLDGSIGYIVAKADLILDEKDEPSKMIGINFDVSELEEAKRSIEVRELQLRRFVEQAPVSVAMFDKAMNYLSVSNQWYSEYGLESKSVIGKCHYDVFPEIRKNQTWLDDHKRVLAGEELSSPRDKFVRKNGAIQYLSWKLIPWKTSENKIGGIIMYTADITNEIKYQDKLENLNEVLEHQVKLRTEELQIVNQELESFSYSVSHDLRAPLRSINGFSDILKEDYEDQLDDEGKRLIGIIKDSAVNMGQLIDDILNFSRLGRRPLEKERIDMYSLFTELIESQVEQFGVSSKIEIAIEKIPSIKGDIVMLKQALVNLIGNAIKYSDRNEKIKIEVGSTSKEDQVIYFIKDNGSGFDSSKYQDKIFGVFQRLHTKKEFEGTGVGLAIVKRIIEKHKGDVWAESQPTKGATFFFSLPK